jgi:hypothetical protein
MPRRPQSKEERLAAALRENLKRRKQAARRRDAVAAAPQTETAKDRPNTAKNPD